MNGFIGPLAVFLDDLMSINEQLKELSSMYTSKKNGRAVVGFKTDFSTYEKVQCQHQFLFSV